MKIQSEPNVFLVAKTQVTGGIEEYLKHIGDPDWKKEYINWLIERASFNQKTDLPSDADMLFEAAGRLCYRSWEPYNPEKPDATNPNVTKVRKGNKNYLKNVINSGHGSVLEHAGATFIIECSRVCTHEIVRNRAGIAISQESLRYVRLDQLRFWLPKSVKDSPEAMDFFENVVMDLEKVQKDLAKLFKIEELKDFAIKKALTSMFRRLAPMGLGTTIMITGNLRAWRHVIEQRSSIHAEEEMRLVIDKIATILKEEFPSSFQDFARNEQGEWVSSRAKV